MARLQSSTGDGPADDPFLPDRGRPRHSLDYTAEHRVAVLAGVSAGVVAIGLGCAVFGLLVSPPIFGLGLGLAIAGAIVCATCFIVAGREGWS